MVSGSRSLLSAGGCLVVITGAIHTRRQDELTDAIWAASSAPFVANHYVRVFLAAVSNGISSRELLCGLIVIKYNNKVCERPVTVGSYTCPLFMPAPAARCPLAFLA
jgi:hypothetical protein